MIMRDEVDTGDFWDRVRVYKDYETVCGGKVRVVRQCPDVQEKIDGKKRSEITAEMIRVKFQGKTAAEDISIREIILPEKKKPLSPAERKQRYDNRKKALGCVKVTVDIDPENRWVLEELSSEYGSLSAAVNEFIREYGENKSFSIRKIRDYLNEADSMERREQFQVVAKIKGLLSGVYGDKK